ncbi:carbohydrate ABC transporter permease [Paenibacillus sp. SEL3]|jgi:lactose/L-arabinose transport system permease protein|uniref:Carbohydrate ABC transporter permease n=1 Tax=Paenibacillus polymyxa TaxID=1406 RepID=A0A8I1LVL9_PAEPO|nr:MULTISPECIES: carbohydrate ABC transporter permease [Paenibacillus]KAF6627757.1 carbohydrate ABC transporter permease [Paenibacillus sp. EKM208P]ADM68116.1 lactose ABC transporter permease [Paenibacillus polymyxa E681]KAF6571841.1 carbohydrate ABC transporter permease [Paenibacillus sp. EKM206P]KAF6586554.1 carbohydrate ABC transporter permease [Paenibacillus sp. EKM205P]KEO76906.1 lactose ABC transporter permease [Paenibacillus polymyxa]
MMKTKRAFTYAFLILVSFVSIFPFLWMLSSATNLSVDVTKGKLLPGSHLMDNMHNLLEKVDIVTALSNSAKVSISTTLLAMLIASLAGYGFEIYRSKAKDVVFNILLMSMMIPFAAIMIPLYRMFGSISNVIPWIGIDTLSSVVIPTVTTAFLIFFFRQSTKMFPKDLLEAGRMDGLSELGLFFRVYMPTMKTTYAAAAIITFMSSWNNYLWPLIVLQTPENQTIPLLISNLGSSYAPDYGVIMIAIVLSTLPTALVFFLMQKHFVAGMVGSVK